MHGQEGNETYHEKEDVRCRVDSLFSTRFLWMWRWTYRIYERREFLDRLKDYPQFKKDPFMYSTLHFLDFTNRYKSLPSSVQHLQALRMSVSYSMWFWCFDNHLSSAIESRYAVRLFLLAATTVLSFCTDRMDFVEVSCKEHMEYEVAVADEVRSLQLRPAVSSQMKAVFRLRPGWNSTAVRISYVHCEERYSSLGDRGNNNSPTVICYETFA